MCNIHKSNKIVIKHLNGISMHDQRYTYIGCDLCNTLIRIASEKWLGRTTKFVRILTINYYDEGMYKLKKEITEHQQMHSMQNNESK